MVYSLISTYTYIHTYIEYLCILVVCVYIYISLIDNIYEFNRQVLEIACCFWNLLILLKGKHLTY